MISDWLKNITSNEDGLAEKDAAALDIERVTAHLLIEVARADFEIEAGELATISKAITEASELGQAEVSGIVANANEEVDENISYHEHVAYINDKFSLQQKRQLLDCMWRVAFSDDELHKYEEAFIRRFADLIYMSHKEFMQSKHRVITPDA